MLAWWGTQGPLVQEKDVTIAPNKFAISPTAILPRKGESPWLSVRGGRISRRKKPPFWQLQGRSNEIPYSRLTRKELHQLWILRHRQNFIYLSHKWRSRLSCIFICCFSYCYFFFLLHAAKSNPQSEWRGLLYLLHCDRQKLLWI